MKHKHLVLLVFLLKTSFAFTQTDRPTDKESTPEAVHLYKKLKSLNGKYLVGHQDALAYGVNWKYVDSASDIKNLVGDYPALYGWELGGIEQGAPKNLDGVPFDAMRQFIKDGYRRGGVITISWHARNPVNDSTAWDTTRHSVANILPGQRYHKKFVRNLNRVAVFLSSLKDDTGKPIPILFRPFHECTGNWFWWGVTGGNPSEFKQLFRFTVGYLREKMKLHNLLIVYNTGTEYDNEDEFLRLYPGDDIADVVSFDTYERGDPELSYDFAEKLDSKLGIAERMAARHDKIGAIAEIGYNGIPLSRWFTKIIEPVFKKHKFAYMLLWRNAGYHLKSGKMEYYAPFAGHPSASDFLDFYKAPETIFGQEAKELSFYTP
ncbi:glycoside hydrolase family 26 protein [Mucilaginibacter dorajii]|uniref:Mannan endo-1,4-beta-mannosidase n=1 Tax=Mucilaginibacter dorajii TaxID=692994 RepID=A0ABP7QYC9_9SPHI|nr:glycoside hydrolase family 26 protein [Mucilaginibacter dorajii]MCS3732443.1 mannan endo-1,4-beta-mannosidase [Mucilaginibacter dorajii]